MLGRTFRQRKLQSDDPCTQGRKTPTINVIEDRLIFPLFNICNFCHTNSTLSTIESVEELMLHLLPAVDGFRLQVSVPVESNTLKGSDELFHQPISLSSRIIVRFNEMCNVLLRVALFIELIELRRLISIRHAKSINPLHVRLCI